MANCTRCDRPATVAMYKITASVIQTGKAHRVTSTVAMICSPCMKLVMNYTRIAPGRCEMCMGWAPIMCDDGRKVCSCESR